MFARGTSYAREGARRLAPWRAGACLAIVGLVASAAPQAQQPGQGGSLQVLPVRGDIHVLSGPAGNTTVQIGRDGVLVVDTRAAAEGPDLVAAIRRLTSRPVRMVINTTLDPDHSGGNQAVASSGQVLGSDRSERVYSAGEGAPIWAHEGVLRRLSAAGGDATRWPTDTYFVAQKDLFFNGEPVQNLHAAAAHTDGDSMVMFRRTDVISAGDVFTPDRYPVIDLARGGSINGPIDAVNHLLRRTVPEFNQQGGTLVIPGHGRLSDEADVSEYRDMVTIVRDRVRDMVQKKLTLAQVQTARPTMDYDGAYGGQAAGAVFVEQVYRSLTAGAGPGGAR